LAVKIVRQVKNIALIGAPTSAAALTTGHERGPAALRDAGLVARLSSAGFQVTDCGDCTLRSFEVDEEHPRARNVRQVIAALEELRPKIELAVKSGALPLIIGGDSSIVLATIAGTRRYFRNITLIDVDRDGGLNVPATTPSGCVDGMVISHVIGRGAPELVRFWGEPPLLREPEVALFGIDRLDAPEQQFLERSPLRRYTAEEIRRSGATATAEKALARMHEGRQEFILHIDLDVISADEFAATNRSAPGGLRFAELREALAVFARHPMLAAIEIAGYNPALDPGGAAAEQLMNLLVDILAPRLNPPATAEEIAGEGQQTAAASINDVSAPAADSQTAAATELPASDDLADTIVTSHSNSEDKLPDQSVEPAVSDESSTTASAAQPSDPETSAS